MRAAPDAPCERRWHGARPPRGCRTSRQRHACPPAQVDRVAVRVVQRDWTRRARQYVRVRLSRKVGARLPPLPTARGLVIRAFVQIRGGAQRVGSIASRATGRPALDGQRECLLDCFFGNVDIAEDAHQYGHGSTVLLAEDTLDLQLRKRCHCSMRLVVLKRSELDRQRRQNARQLLSPLQSAVHFRSRSLPTC
jgi:hypothetical protein